MRAHRGASSSLATAIGTQAGVDSTAWAGRMSPEVRDLFLLAKGLAADLDRAARRGGACLIAATAMGGRFASTDRGDAGFFPGAGSYRRPGEDDRPRVELGPDPSDRSQRERRRNPIGRSASCRDSPRRCLDGSWLRGLATDQAAGDPGAPWSQRRARMQRFSARESPWSSPAGARYHIAGCRRVARRWQPTLLLIGTTPVPDGPAGRARRACQCDSSSRPLYMSGYDRGTVRIAHGTRTGVPAPSASSEVRPILSCCVPWVARSSMHKSMSAIRPPHNRLEQMATRVRRACRFDSWGRPDSRQAAPQQVPRLVRSRARHEARRRSTSRDCSGPSISGSRSSFRRSRDALGIGARRITPRPMTP